MACGDAKPTPPYGYALAAIVDSDVPYRLAIEAVVIKERFGI
ncbi:hypothetical protein [Altererythrobacter sp. Root672]|nr:hypothetical protein [Altererythrobacter sp. Root672]